MRRPTAAPLLGLMLTSATAHADDQHMRFEDDPLLGDTLAGHVPILRVNPRARRVTLLRPRTEFVRELLKTTDGF